MLFVVRLLAGLAHLLDELAPLSRGHVIEFETAGLTSRANHLSDPERTPIAAAAWLESLSVSVRRDGLSS
jgi:hypothetical protein